MRTKKERAKAKQLLSKPRGAWEEVTKEEYPASWPQWMTRCYKNNRFTVMVNDTMPTETGFCIMAYIQRLDDKPIPNHWAEIQRIKNELFGSKMIGIEFYPPETSVIDEANIYWLFTFPTGRISLPDCIVHPNKKKF